MNNFLKTNSDTQGPKYELLLITFLAIIVFILYAKTLTGDFIFDDWHNIKNNPYIRLTQLSPKSLIRAAHESPLSNRPLANISFALNYYLHRYNVVGFHLVNIFIHIASGILLYFFIGTTLRTPTLYPHNIKHEWVPFFTAFIWLVHPLQTQSVSYVVQRMNSMTAMFYILSMLLYAQARLAEGKRKRRVLFSTLPVAGILALGSKEIAATLPFFIFLYEWFFFQDLSWEWLKKRLAVIAAIILLLIILSVIYCDGNPLERIMAGYATHHLTMAQRGLSQFRVVMFYIGLLLWPHPSRLNLDHDLQPSISLVDPITTLPAIGAIIAIICLAILLAKKDRLISFCILWFFGNLAIESSIIGLELVFEHRNYLPSMFFILMVVLLSYRYIKPKWGTSIILLTVAMVCAVWTFERNDVWRSPVLIWKDCAEKSPQNPRPFNNLGVALAAQGYLKEATAQYHKALQLNPHYADAHANLGQALARQGMLDEAINHFLIALKINPEYYEAHSNFGIALAIQGRHQEAIQHFSAALKIKPNYVKAHNNLGVALKRQGHLQQAVEHFVAALELDPSFAAAHNNLGMALVQQGRLDQAIEHFSAALRIDPGYVSARSNLEESLEKKKQADKKPLNQQ
ncbi:MAG: tetratricopeptide repeat protein [Desulfobacterales bacterium]|nr:MAG: tetratricopeptide repeat protein [Desulfobacterales bacterium]